MAGIVNSKNMKAGAKSCDILLDGGIHSRIKATVVKELIKYFMYERQQIPVPFEHLRKEINRINANPEVLRSKKRQCVSRQAKEEKKKLCLMSRLTELMSQVESAFHVYPELAQVLIVLGSTIVSPKESYLIQFPPPTPEVESVAEKTCIKSVFRQLIMQDVLGDVKPISPTNLSVMLFAPRDSGIKWFQPKPSLKKPHRGKQFIYNVSCTGHAGSHDMSCDIPQMEISGVEPLEISCVSGESDVDDVSMDDNSTSTGCDSSENTSTGSSADCTVLSVNSQVEVKSDRVISPCQTEEEIIWFQSPVFVKGFREKLPGK